MANVHLNLTQFDAAKYGGCGICFHFTVSEQAPFRLGQDMVLRKRFKFGSHGHHVSVTPSVPTLPPVKYSARRKKSEIYALDLLATTAGVLSADQEHTSSRPNINGKAASYATNRKLVQSEQFDDVLPFKSIARRKDCCDVCTMGCAGVCGSSSLRQTNTCLAENSSTQSIANSVLESVTAKQDVLAEDSLVSCKKVCQLGCGLVTIPEYQTIGVYRPWSIKSAEVKQVQRARPTMIRSQVDGNAKALHSLVGAMDLGSKLSCVVSSDSSSGVHPCVHDRDTNCSPLCYGKVQHAARRDDDENSSGCVLPSTSGNRGGYMPHYVGDCRIRRLFATRLRKAARNKIGRKISYKGRKLNFYGKNIFSTRRTVQQTMFRRKRMIERCFARSSDDGIQTKTSETSFSMGGQGPPCASEDYHVKLTIKSLNIPELLIEIPENATVGSLKRTVVDAVTTIIEGGLRVGVLHQGKNIQDDNKTLIQAGICHGGKLDSIGFTLECEAGQDSHHGLKAPEEMDFISAHVVEPLAMMKCEELFPETRVGDDRQQPMQAFPKCALSDPVEWTTQETSSEQLAFGQRRMRRPFSVAEVEALVEAVEQLGTGRWRDIKFHGFGNADHRTYVDLKDKWKTLVHTASISPQQRRGKVIPQELLDRVLAAQAYWSQQQAQLLGSPPFPDTDICPA